MFLDILWDISQWCVLVWIYFKHSLDFKLGKFFWIIPLMISYPFFSLFSFSINSNFLDIELPEQFSFLVIFWSFCSFWNLRFHTVFPWMLCLMWPVSSTCGESQDVVLTGVTNKLHSEHNSTPKIAGDW